MGAGIDDVVSLKDGSLLRGVIIERSKSDSVTLLLPSGQSRRFQMAEVSYAGPVAAIPPPTAPGSNPNIARSLRPELLPPVPEVRLSASEPLEFSILTGTSEGWLQGGRAVQYLSLEHYGLLCTAPCALELKKGRYRFALSREGHIVSTDQEVAVAPGDTVSGRYESFHGLRTAGYVVMATGTAIGLTYALIGLAQDRHCDPASGQSQFSACVNDEGHDDDARQRHWVIGVGVALSSFLIGGALALKQDEASVKVSAGVTPLVSGRWISDRGLGSYEPRGLTLSARF